MASSVLTFVIVGDEDHPIFEADLAARGGDAATRDDQSSRSQYLHQFVLHAALDAVEEQQWQTSAMHLGVVDKFNNLQVLYHARVFVAVKPTELRQGTPAVLYAALNSISGQLQRHNQIQALSAGVSLRHSSTGDISVAARREK